MVAANNHTNLYILICSCMLFVKFEFKIQNSVVKRSNHVVITEPNGGTYRDVLLMLMHVDYDYAYSIFLCVLHVYSSESPKQ